MATVTELFEQFVANHLATDFAYHLHILENLIEERDDVIANIAANHKTYRELPYGTPQQEVVDLRVDLEHYDAQLDRMNRVLDFVGGATKGYLLTKVVSTLEWEYQEPVHFTENDEIADLAFKFFNAHAIITQ